MAQMESAQMETSKVDKNALEKKYNHVIYILNACNITCNITCNYLKDINGIIL